MVSGVGDMECSGEWRRGWEAVGPELDMLSCLCGQGSQQQAILLALAPTVFSIVVNPAPRGRWTHERWVLLGRFTSQRTASEFFFLEKKLALSLMLF